MQSTPSTRNLSAWLVVFCLVALGAKLWAIQIWATNIPYWDQWDEARLLFKPWLEGTLTWHDFFIPHNEHRIVFTRLLDLLEVKLNGQWDPMFQMVVNAVIHVAYGCGLAVVIWDFTGRKYAGPICVLLLPFFALPFAAENTIRGFQSQEYFLNIFSVAGMIGLGFNKPGRGAWFCGLVAAALAIFTMASGFLAAVALAGLIFLRSCKQREITRGQILTLICGLAVVALGLVMKVSVAEHKRFQANTLPGFCHAFLGNLAWPFDHSIAAVLFCLPLVVVVVRYFQNDFKNPRAAEFVLMFGLWGFLQAAALAFGRANLGVSSRYFDTLSTIPIADVAAIFVLADDPAFFRLPQKFTLATAILWLGILLAGMCECSRAVAEDYSRQGRLWGLLETENVRAFIATDDPSWLTSKLVQATPYWNAGWLIDMLRQPKLLSIMPTDVRPPLKLEPDETLSAGFGLNDFPAGQPGQPFTTAWGDGGTNQVHAPGHFVSQPLSAHLPKLAIQLYRGTAPGVLIQFDEASGRTIELHPQTANYWQTLIVDAPPSPFRLEIKNPNADAPVAVGEIKELGRFSVAAQNLTACAAWILFIGLFLCVILAGATLAGSAVSFGCEGVVWLLILLTGFAALAGTWCWRDLNATEYTVALQKYWSAQWASAGFPGRAELHLREALWLQPNDAEAQSELGILQARSGALPPEKIP